MEEFKRVEAGQAPTGGKTLTYEDSEERAVLDAILKKNTNED